MRIPEYESTPLFVFSGQIVILFSASIDFREFTPDSVSSHVHLERLSG